MQFETYKNLLIKINEIDENEAKTATIGVIVSKPSSKIEVLTIC